MQNVQNVLKMQDFWEVTRVSLGSDVTKDFKSSQNIPVRERAPDLTKFVLGVKIRLTFDGTTRRHTIRQNILAWF